MVARLDQVPTALIIRLMGPHVTKWEAKKDKHMLQQVPKIPQKEKQK